MTQKTTFRFRSLIAVGLLLCGSILNAQETVQENTAAAAQPVDSLNAEPQWYRHEFSIYGGGGLSTLLYKVNSGDHKNGFGGHFGLGYHFFFNPNWGLGTGVEAAMYNARYINDISLRYMTVDPEGASFEFRSNVNGYEEKQRAVYLQIPLMVQYQTGKKRQFFAAAGAKLGLRLSDRFSNSSNYVQNSGYYEYEEYEYTEQTFRGFGRFEGRKNSGSFDFSPALFASAETGIKWRLNNSWALYTGVYIDYGINNIKPDYDANPFVHYNASSPADFIVNSAIISGTSNVEKINPLAAGVKVRLAFGKTYKKKEPAQQSSAGVLPVDTIPQPADTIPQPADDAAKQAADDAAKQAADDAAKQAADDAAKKAADDAAKQAADDAAKKAADEAAKQAADDKLHAVDNYVISHGELSVEQKQRWDKNITWLQQHPNVKVFIYGHTCNAGTAAINERLGKQRAETVKAYLLSKGIEPSRILGTASKRDTEPVVPNDTEANRRLNRRVELVVQ